MTMYGLPANVDLSFLQNRDLDQICFGAYQVQFNFDKNVRVFIQNAFSYVDSVGSVFEMKTAASSTMLVDRLIGKTVTEVKPSQDGTLQITFNTGEKLILYDDDKAYECYEIGNREKTIVV
jgi:hypothetical protein